jgi:beta-glucanase (GH16 family)
MRQFLCLTAGFVLLAGGCATEPFSSSDNVLSVYKDDGYRLVWADEFNTDGRPDPANWTYENGFVRNEELQWYQPENAVCEDGWLVIEGRRETVPNPRYEPGSRRWQRRREQAEYTSACLKTIGLREWLYGRFEIRAKIETRPGLWPAIWTLGSARGWPACGEIDIMEYYDDSILANACWAEGRRRAQWDTVKIPLSEFNDPDWGDKVHIWRMDWDADKIEIFVDGELLNTIEIEKTINSRTGITPFREPHYILLNLAIGGTRGGDPSKTGFPSRYEIDYVRVYQKQQ